MAFIERYALENYIHWKSSCMLLREEITQDTQQHGQLGLYLSPS